MERSAAVLAGAGFPKMPARVLMALMAAPDGGLTAAELCEQLAISPAAVSGAVRYLQTVGIVHRIAQPSSRRDRYEVPSTNWYGLLAGKSPLYGILAELAEEAARAIADGSSAQERMADVARFYRFLETRLPEVMQEWEELRKASS